MSEEPETFVTDEEKTWGMIAHLSAFLGLVIPGIGSILGPLVIWLLKRDRYPFVADQGKEALNFNISIFVYGIICYVLFLVVIGVFLLGLVFLFWIIMTIVAMLKAQEGVAYRYPLTIRFIK